jgi:hypothetical protein
MNYDISWKQILPIIWQNVTNILSLMKVSGICQLSKVKESTFEIDFAVLSSGVVIWWVLYMNIEPQCGRGITHICIVLSGEVAFKRGDWVKLQDCYILLSATYKNTNIIT